MTGSRPQPWGDAKPQDMSIKKELPRLRVQYIKDDRLAYLGHLEVLETINRCIRRAQLPFSIGNGWARRMRIQFTQALPVGASSECEYYDLRLSEQLDIEEALSRLVASTPEALAPVRAAYVSEPQAALEAWLTRALWKVELVSPKLSAQELTACINDVWQQGNLTYMRGDKEKVIDLSGALVGFEAADCEGGIAMELDTRSSNLGALRPRVLVDAALSDLGEDAYGTLRVRRIGQWHEDVNGRLVNPL